MADDAETSKSSLERSDTMATDDSSGQSMQDVRPSSSFTMSPSREPNALDPAASSAKSRPSTSSSVATRKRKVPESVTPNACNHCKKARAKCDGVKPACKRCINRSLRDTCIYELHAKTAKEEMIREIQRLQRKNEDLEDEKDTLGEKNGYTEKIIRSLKDNGRGTEIINRLKQGQSHQQIAEWLGHSFVTTGGVGADPDDLSPTTERNITEAITRYHSRMVADRDPRYWTSVTPEASFIEHLVNLYLTWIHPAHMLFDEDHFMASFRDCSDIYCSAALVNAICAMSCCLLHDESWENDEQTTAGIQLIRDKFLDETKRLMCEAEMRKTTAIQTYAVMFLVEVSSGRALIGSSHLRLAVETLLSRSSSEQSSEAEEIAMWGILTLQTAWSAFTYQKPTAPLPTKVTPLNYTGIGKEDPPWGFYKQPGNLNVQKRPSFSLLTASEQAKLFRLIHESILLYCGNRGRISARALLDLYERYVDWKEHLPTVLADQDTEPLPHVSFLHIQYYVALVHLLRPLLHLDQIYGESYERLRDIVVGNAKRGLELQHQYYRLYSSHYLPPFQLFCLVHLCDTVVRYDAPDAETRNECIYFCFTFLEQAKVGYPVAGALQKMFRLALSEYEIPVSDDMERHLGASVRLGREELLESCTRSSYHQPIAQISPSMEPNLAQEFIDGYQRHFEGRTSDQSSSTEARGKQRRVDIGTLLNT